MSNPKHRDLVIFGAIVWILALQFFVAQAVTQWAWTTPFSLAENYISDLGHTACGYYSASGKYICSPWYALMNTSFVLQGVIILVGAASVRNAFEPGLARTAGLVLLALSGLGIAVVGLYPENVSHRIHALGAVVYFVAGNLGIVVLGIAIRHTQWAVAAYSVGSTVVGLLATVLFLAEIPLGVGVGGMERVAACPQPLWLAVVGISLLRRKGAMR